MKLYEKEAMAERRAALEVEILAWTGVAPGQMFGTPCYKARGKLFAFLVTDGIVLTNLAEDDRTLLARERKAGPFHPNRNVVQKWCQIPSHAPADVRSLVPFVRKSYAAAGKRPAAEASRPHTKSRKRPRT